MSIINRLAIFLVLLMCGCQAASTTNSPIAHIELPGTANRGEPITITAWSRVLIKSYNTKSELFAKIIEGEKRVELTSKYTEVSAFSVEQPPALYSLVSSTASILLNSTGIYSVIAVNPYQGSDLGELAKIIPNISTTSINVKISII